jgi:hypothetical protein
LKAELGVILRARGGNKATHAHSLLGARYPQAESVEPDVAISPEADGRVLMD